MALETLNKQTPSEDTTDKKQDENIGTGKSTALKINKNITLPSIVGGSPVPSSTLENLQKMYDERLAQRNSLMENLRDATAWWSGGLQGPGEALAKRAEERSAQASELFNMQNAIAQYKANQEQLSKIKREDAASGWGTPTAGAAGAAPTIAGGFPAEVVAQYNRILETQGIEKANAFKNEQLKILSQYNMNPALDAIVKFPVDGVLVDMTLRQAKKMAENNPQLKSYLDKIAPGISTTSTTTTPAATTTAAAPSATTTTATTPSATTTTTPAATTTTPAATTTTPAATTTTPAATTPAAPAGQVIKTPTGGGGGGGNLPSSANIQQRMEIEKAEQLARTKGREKEFEKIGEQSAKHVDYIETSHGSATNDLASYDKLNTLVTNNPYAFGVLQRADILSGALNAIKQGANVGNYNVNLPGVETLVRQAGGTDDDVTAANMAIREFAKLQLNASKLIQGQGSVSDAERRLLEQVAGSASDDPRTIKDMIKWGKARVEFDKQMGDAWKRYLKANPNGSYREFYIHSAEREKIVQNWENKTKEMLKDYESLGKKSSGSDSKSDAKKELERRKTLKKQTEGQ